MSPAGFIVDNWGRWRTLWVESERIEACLDQYRANEIDGLGLNPLRGYDRSDIGFLRECPDVGGLVIVPSLERIDLRGLEQLRLLRYLSLSDDAQPCRLAWFPYLEEFWGDYHRALDLQSPSDKLRALHLWKYKPKSKDVTELAAIAGVEDLSLTQTTIPSLAGIEAFTRLRRLEISYARNLMSLRPLLRVLRLESLRCDRCPRLGDYEVLREMDGLSVLHLNSCGPIDSLSWVLDVPGLEEFRFVGTEVRDGDLSPLLEHPSIQRIGFVNKRHYSHSLDEIAGTIGARNDEHDST